MTMICRKIGDVFNMQFWNGSGWTIYKLRVVEGGVCSDCFLHRDSIKCFYSNKNSTCGACGSTFRDDNKQVHFVKIGVQSYSNFNYEQ